MPLFANAVDRQFLRFCRTGDAAALGCVFDRTAPELLRVACYLSGNRTDAEDLVQRTFLAAIESRSSFAANARAVPWLLGILANHGKQLQRERRRTAPPIAEPAVDPSDAAAQRELVERLAALRSELDPRYADVLQLHLEQGLNAKEIAARLQRPAGTVRTQLMRALAVLRDRLPDGFVAGSALVILGRTSSALAPGLAVIRQAVVRAATTTTAKTAAGVAPLFVLGSWVVTKKIAAVASFMLFASLLSAWAAWPGATDAQRTVAAAGAAPATSSPGAERSATGAPDARAVAAPERSSAAAAAGTLIAAEPGFAVLRVRVRRGDQPLAGIGVFASSGHTAARRDAVSDANGFAVLAHLLPGAWTVSSTLGNGDLPGAGQPQRCTLAAGEVHDVELSVIALAQVDGRVVDADGRAVPDARIWMSIDGDFAVGHEVARSDGNGAFRLPIHGAHHVGTRKAGFAPSHTVVVDPHNATEKLELRLVHAGGRVRGVVRDHRGAPIAWAKVLVGEEITRLLNSTTRPTSEQRPRGVEVSTDANGCYAVDCAPLGLAELRAWAPGFAPFAGGVDVPATGAATADVALAPGATVQGTVHDSTGAGIAGAVVRWGRDHEFARRQACTDAAGNYVLDDLPAGDHELVAENGGAQTAARLALVAGAAARWDPVLGTSLPIRGRVVGANGEGLAGCDIEAWTGSEQHGNTTTDAHGAFTLPDAGVSPCELYVSLNLQVLLRVPGVAPGRDDVLVTLTAEHLPSAFANGCLVDDRGQPVAASLVPWHSESDRALNHHSDGKTGAFHIGPLRPGHYRLVTESPAFGRSQIAEFDVAANETRELGEHVLKTPGAVEFTITMDGRPATGGLLFLRLPDGSWSDTLTIEQGKARHGALPPGPLYVTADSPGRAQNLELRIEAGITVHANVDLQRAWRATVTLHDPRGRSPEQLAPTLIATHPDGSFAGLFGAVGLPGAPQFFAEMPAGRYLLRATASDGRTATGEVDLRSGHTAVKLELPR